MASTVKVLSHRKVLKAWRGALLADVIEEAGIPLNLYCHKRGLCGKCFVEIVKGERPIMGEKERSLLAARSLGARYRLACLHKTGGDLEIRVPSFSLSPKIPILPSLSLPPLILDPAVKKYFLSLKMPGLQASRSLLDLFSSRLGRKHLHIPLDLMMSLAGHLAEGRSDVTATLHRDKEILDIERGDTRERNFGLALDVGTTTLVLELLDLNSGQVIDTEAALNSQSKHGADVLSRISYALEAEENREKLRKTILAALNLMIKNVLRRNKISPSALYEIIVSGNTAMNHLLLGLPMATLALAPYNSVFSYLPYYAAETVGFKINPRGKVYFSPNIMSYVGGDISSGLLATRLEERDGNFLFIDLGTNGEIVLKSKEGLVATSTAAGPAFEGMNIACGMPALPGAIYRVEDKGRLKLWTLKDKPAAGICGTGLIDLISVFLARKKISRQGSLLVGDKKISIAREIFLTQEDIRQVQLACAAIKTGIRLMLKECSLGVDDLDGAYIAGAFGNYLNTANAMKIGLLPSLPRNKITFIGNSSLAGARLLLLSQKERDRAEALVQRIHYLSLARDPAFQDQFIQALRFGTWA